MSRYLLEEPGERRNRDGTLKRAKELRRNMTDAEKLLWSRIRRDQIDELPFRKQVPIGPYVADFACLPIKLVIEVYGRDPAFGARPRRRACRTSRPVDRGIFIPPQSPHLWRLQGMKVIPVSLRQLQNGKSVPSRARTIFADSELFS